jgi:hypothetical protein
MREPVRYRGRNEFYDGWLARHYQEPDNPTQNEAWREGWRMADETPQVNRIIAFAAEVALGTNIMPV